MTLGECTNNVLENLFLTGEKTSVAHTAIQTALDFYKRKRFWFNEEISTGNTSNGTERYALPSDFGEVLTLSVTVNSNTYPLKRRNRQEMEDLYISGSNYTGYPQDFSIERNEIRLGPIPNGTYVLTLYYRKEPETATADTQTNIFLTNAEPMIRFRASAYMAANYSHDVELAQIFKIQADEEYNNMTGESNQRMLRGSGKRRS